MGRLFVSRRGIATIPSETFNDERLSWAALGILTAALNRSESDSQGYRAFMRTGVVVRKRF